VVADRFGDHNGFFYLNSPQRVGHPQKCVLPSSWLHRQGWCAEWAMPVPDSHDHEERGGVNILIVMISAERQKASLSG
jgi:hypothetical protein